MRVGSAGRCPLGYRRGRVCRRSGPPALDQPARGVRPDVVRPTGEDRRGDQRRCGASLRSSRRVSQPPSSDRAVAVGSATPRGRPRLLAVQFGTALVLRRTHRFHERAPAVGGPDPVGRSGREPADLRHRLDDDTPHNHLHVATDLVRELGPPDPHARRTGHARDAGIQPRAAAAASRSSCARLRALGLMIAEDVMSALSPMANTVR